MNCAGCVVLECRSDRLRGEWPRGVGTEERHEAGYQKGLIESDVLWHCNAITYLQTPRLFQRKTGMHESVELAAERVEVLRNVHVEK